ncbi:MAG: cation:proton antiporter [Peptococcaceae bacterium]|jgi:CPA2 family monovalent cation:H+ antiporter-2|nr:cation:proton antiporter [Peptococcaceae bacterium]MBQ2020888.1 cation:proton antiporter [Peptococcaceae bacterium]
MGHLATLISDLALLLVVAGITTLFCKKINQPTVIGYILAGFLIGPVVSFIPTIGDSANITLWAEIGVIFLMFSLGLEFSLHKLVTVGTTGIISALVQIIGMLILGIIMGLALGWSTMDSIFLGGMLSMSSTMITIKAIEDLGLKEERFTGLAIGTLVIEDIVAIFLLVILSTISVSQGVSGVELVFTIGKLMFYLVLWLLLGIYLIPSFLQKTQDLMSDETLLVTSLGICFAMVWLADAIGFSTALGAFLAGSILAGTIHGERVEHLVTPCKDLFGAVFFVSVGLMVVPSMLVEYFVPILLLTIAVIIGKAVLLVLGMAAAGEDMRTSMYGAMSQTQIGEFSFIIANLGISLGVTSGFLYPVIVAVSVVTTFTTPFFIKSSDKAVAILDILIPDRWQEALKRYRQERLATEKEEKNPEWKEFFKGYFTRFFIYGILLLGVGEIGITILYPALNGIVGRETLDAIITCVLIYIVTVPMLPPMVLSKSKNFTTLWLQSYANRLPLVVLLGVRIAVATFLMVRPVCVLLHIPAWMLAIAAFPIVIYLSRSKAIIGRQLEMEAHFLLNFNEKKLQEFQESTGGQSHAWLDTQLMVESYVCPENSEAIGQTLKTLQWGRIFQVNIIKIVRDNIHINIPEGDEILRSGDILYVLGTEQTLTNFSLMNGHRDILMESAESPVTLHQFIEGQDDDAEDHQLFMCAVPVKKESGLSGVSIRDSRIKSEWSANLIGIERGVLPILNPAPDFMLNTDDLMWVIGSKRMGQRLIQKGLL